MKFAIIEATNGSTIDDAACACRAGDDRATFNVLFELEADDIDAACDIVMSEHYSNVLEADYDCISDNITIIEFDGASGVVQRAVVALD